jgi:hypothetical protein
MSLVNRLAPRHLVVIQALIRALAAGATVGPFTARPRFARRIEPRAADLGQAAFAEA